jgi:hypothetical protein
MHGANEPGACRRHAPRAGLTRVRTQNALIPVNSRPMVSWWIVSVPS